MTDVNEQEASAYNALKRPRPVISCLECRRKKLRCDRTIPCQQCIKAGRPSTCTYQPGQAPECNDQNPSQKRSRTNALDATVIASPSPSVRSAGGAEVASPAVARGTGLLEQLVQRVTRLEQLAGTSSPHGAVFNQTSKERSPWRTQSPGKHRGPNRKSTGRDVFPDAVAFMRELSGPSSNISILKVGKELQNLYATLKTFHKPRKALSTPFNHSQLLQLLPTRSVCETLIELYFDNLEHCFRILHRPTFNQQLHDFWEQGGSDEAGSFLPQFLGVISVASMLNVRRECAEVSVASENELVSKSVDLMLHYFDGLNPKRRYTISALQIKMLLLLLRWMRLDRMDDLWNLSGQILRHALIMELDKDPSESLDSMSFFQAELRRRLWMTVVEQDMMLSILCNMTCMVPEFTCLSPLNINDDELREGLTDVPPSRPVTEWTDTLCQFVLAQSISQRLQACKDLEAPGTLLYNQCLEHTRCFEEVLQNLPAPLRFNHQGDQASKAPARLMARMELDISIRRPLMHLYSPFAYANDGNDVYHEARIGFLQSSLMLTTYQDLFDPKFSEIDVESPQGYWDFFYNVYRQEYNQAALGLCLEIKRLMTTVEPESASAHRPTSSLKIPQHTKGGMIDFVRDAIEAMIRRITRAGANLEDLVYLTIVFNSVRTANHDRNVIVEALEELVTECKSQLEHDGIEVLLTPSDSRMNGNAQDFSGSVEFDPSWMDFPDLGLDLEER